jgi:DNA mismatch repair protein MutS
MPQTTMERRRDAKATFPDSVVLMREADFYEAYGDDARIVALVIGLTITTSRHDPAARMTGFPYHQLDGFVRKLMEAGHKVTVCEAKTTRHEGLLF